MLKKIHKKIKNIDQDFINKYGIEAYHKMLSANIYNSLYGVSPNNIQIFYQPLNKNLKNKIYRNRVGRYLLNKLKNIGMTD